MMDQRRQHRRVLSANATGKGKGRGRSHADNSGSESSDEEIDIAGIQEPELDDEEFERIHGDKLRGTPRAQAKKRKE